MLLKTTMERGLAHDSFHTGGVDAEANEGAAIIDCVSTVRMSQAASARQSKTDLNLRATRKRARRHGRAAN